MDELLPHYERELALLREKSQAFAQRYPKVAGALQLRGDTSQDPHVERMIESFALLAARVHKRMDDDFPLFTESLLEVLYPHYLRPFPACSIAQFDMGPAAGQLTQPLRIERGAVVGSRPVKGVPCKFRTTQDVALLPVALQGVSFRHALAAPEGTRLPNGATAVLSMSLALTSPQASWGLLRRGALRFHLDGEPSQVCALREALCRKVIGMMVQAQPDQPWLPLVDPHGAPCLPALAGFDEREALIGFDARSHAAYRLLTEYFGFPDKFNFVDLPLNLPEHLLASAPGCDTREADDAAHGRAACMQRGMTIHLLLSGPRADSDEGRLLEAAHARNFLLGCTPVVNLFAQPADPIRVSHATAGYPVVVDARRAFGYEVYSLDKVFRVRQTAQGETVDEFSPFFSLRHDDVWADVDDAGTAAAFTTPSGAPATMAEVRARQDAVGRPKGRYWSAHRDEQVARQSPGYEFELTIVDADFAPALPCTETLSLHVTATNRDLPSMMQFGAPGGDLFMEGGLVKDIRLLRRPTPSHRFERGRGVLWRLISHLSLNHLSLSAGGIDALKEMLRLYDLPRSAINRRQIDGLIAIDFKPATAWLPGEPHATFVRGTAVRLTVDEDSFVGTGLGLFAAMLDRFFALYVHANSFTRLTLISARTQEEVLSCPPRNGDMRLV